MGVAFLTSPKAGIPPPNCGCYFYPVAMVVPPPPKAGGSFFGLPLAGLPVSEPGAFP